MKSNANDQFNVTWRKEYQSREIVNNTYAQLGSGIFSAFQITQKNA